MSIGGDYIRSLIGTVSTFNMTLETVANAFDLEAGDILPEETPPSPEEEEE